MDGQPCLIALDWGSTALRAFLINAEGDVVFERSSFDGASRIHGGPPAFESALRQLVGDWLDQWPGISVLASGMVGSQHGWREVPYLRCPTSLEDLHRGAVVAQGTGSLRILIMPGLLHMPAPDVVDVLRGEETQVFGLLVDQPHLADACMVVMPGTHSKWVMVRDSRVEEFTTWMTGELFSVMRGHSVLGRLMPDTSDFDVEGFDEGLRCSLLDEGAALAHRLFAVRARALLNQLPACSLPDYLSGILVGHELANALRNVSSNIPLALIGESSLCDRYSRALRFFDRAPVVIAGNVVTRGLWKQALHLQ